MLAFITLEWAELVPFFLDNLLPAVQALPPGSSLTETYDSSAAEPSVTNAAPAASARSPIPALPTATTSVSSPPASRVTCSPSDASGFPQLILPPSPAPSSVSVVIVGSEDGDSATLPPTHMQLRHPKPPEPRHLFPDPASAVDKSPETLSARPSKRARGAPKTKSVPVDSDLMPKKSLPPGYTSVRFISQSFNPA
jgi:hypothetical protein